MKKRILSVTTLGCFLVFCWSCYSIQEIKPEVLATARASVYEIRKIEKRTGETIAAVTLGAHSPCSVRTS